MTATYEPNVVLAEKKFDVVGTRPLRHDGMDKVTGAAIYGEDFQTTGLLYGKWLRSPHAHARIKSIDTSKAKALPGVRAVVTGHDLPPTAPGEEWKGTLGTFPLKRLREANLATEKVLFRGHAIAAVAAVNAHVAEEAANLIEVEYEVLPSVMTAPEAMKPGAPLLHDDLRLQEGTVLWSMKESPGKIDVISNVFQHIRHEHGDIDKGFAEADIVIEREFDTATVHQGYIEPHTCTVHWNKDGRVHIWTSTQSPFDVRDMTAGILGLPDTQVKLTPLEIGGGFGGKWETYGESVAALLSKKSGHPVKMMMTRAEELEATGPTPGSHVEVKMGATKEGRIVAAQAILAFEAGGYPGKNPMGAGLMCVFTPYDIPNARVDGYDVVVNKPQTAAYRAPGATNVDFASETVVDELAEKLGLDPIEFRLMNAAKEGTLRLGDPPFLRIGCVEVLEAMKSHPHYTAPLEGPNRGRGVAVGYWFNIGEQSSVNISVNKDGTASLTEGSTDIGGTRTSIAMQAAEVLGIPAEDVHPSVVDTDSIGFTVGTGGSRVTFATGWAAHEAAQDVKRQMIERAALIWEVSPESVEMGKGIISSKADPELKMTFKELAAELNDTGGIIMGRGTISPKGVGGAFAGLIIDVEADPETGKIDILRVTSVQDAGKAIHPSYVEGQMQGGTTQGIGWGLNEEYFMDKDGRMANNSLLDYRMPTSLDLPMIDTVIVEVANPGHPFGVRGVGEVPIVPPPAALANALYRAIGVRMNRLPMNSRSVMEAVWAK
jgi:CO/xanthine dehydrogenase Mo-binding subunit